MWIGLFKEEGSIRLENVMVLTNVNEFREALRDFAIQGLELVRVKNNKARVIAHVPVMGVYGRFMLL